MERLENKSTPAVSPFSIRAIAIGHFTFASLTLVILLLNGLFEGSGIDQSMAGALANVDTPQAQTMKRGLIRTAEIKEGLQQHLSRNVPSSKWIGPITQTVDIGLAIVLLAAGSCLMQKRPLGRILSITFAGICLAQKMITMAWEQLVQIPEARRYIEQIARLYPNDASLFHGILTPIANGPVYQILLAVYPLAVLAVMLQPGIQDLLSPEVPATDVPLEVASSQRILPPMSSTKTPVPDPLEALLQRRTF